MRKDERGFTFVESLIALSCFSVIVLICSMSLKPFMYGDNKRMINQYEWELFLQQMTYQCNQSKGISTNGKTLTMKEERFRIVTYEKYGNKLRRRVNGAGHEVLLQDVKTVAFVVEGNGIEVRIEDDVQVLEGFVRVHHDFGGE